MKIWPFKERRKPVLIVQHAPHEHPAAVRRALESQGIPTIWLHPYRGENYPLLGEIGGMISLGGPMGANDESDHPWINEELDLLKRCVNAELPTVGICLGGQLMAKALGGRVEVHSIAEVGWFPIELSPEGLKDPVIGAAGTTPTVYHWHNDTFHLPTGAVLLAKSRHCDRQAYRVGEQAYGFQFHPEADHQLVLEWLSVEGTEDDIKAVRKIHGAKTVQNSKTQRNNAIGALFRQAIADEIKHSSPAHQSYDDLEEWMTRRQPLLIEFEGSNGEPCHLRGTISSMLSISSGDFVIFQEENALLWPIRIEDIQEVKLLLASL
jgi:GMP synthase (glutamine-hydrolysing)